MENLNTTVEKAVLVTILLKKMIDKYNYLLQNKDYNLSNYNIDYILYNTDICPDKLTDLINKLEMSECQAFASLIVEILYSLEKGEGDDILKVMRNKLNKQFNELQIINAINEIGLNSEDREEIKKFIFEY